MRLPLSLTCPTANTAEPRIERVNENYVSGADHNRSVPGLASLVKSARFTPEG